MGHFSMETLDLPGSALSGNQHTEQVERLAMMVVLILFGGAIVGGLLRPLHWEDWLVAGSIILVVRPVAAMVALTGLRASLRERLMLAFFGIRGVGSFYYLAYAINHFAVAEASRLWALVGLVCLLSILLHGLTVTPLMRSLDRSRGRNPDGGEAPPPGLHGPAREAARI